MSGWERLKWIVGDSHISTSYLSTKVYCFAIVRDRKNKECIGGDSNSRPQPRQGCVIATKLPILENNDFYVVYKDYSA